MTVPEKAKPKMAPVTVATPVAGPPPAPKPPPPPPPPPKPAPETVKGRPFPITMTHDAPARRARTVATLREYDEAVKDGYYIPHWR